MTKKNLTPKEVSINLALIFMLVFCIIIIDILFNMQDMVFDITKISILAIMGELVLIACNIAGIITVIQLYMKTHYSLIAFIKAWYQTLTSRHK